MDDARAIDQGRAIKRETRALPHAWRHANACRVRYRGSITLSSRQRDSWRRWPPIDEEMPPPPPLSFDNRFILIRNSSVIVGYRHCYPGPHYFREGKLKRGGFARSIDRFTEERREGGRVLNNSPTAFLAHDPTRS